MTDADALRTRLVDAGAEAIAPLSRANAEAVLSAFLAATDDTECPNPRCEDGFLIDEDAEAWYGAEGGMSPQCHDCNGSGRVAAGSVLARYLVARDPQAIIDALFEVNPAGLVIERITEARVVDKEQP